MWGHAKLRVVKSCVRARIPTFNFFVLHYTFALGLYIFVMHFTVYKINSLRKIIQCQEWEIKTDLLLKSQYLQRNVFRTAFSMTSGVQGRVNSLRGRTVSGRRGHSHCIKCVCKFVIISHNLRVLGISCYIVNRQCFGTRCVAFAHETVITITRATPFVPSFWTVVKTPSPRPSGNGTYT